METQLKIEMCKNNKELIKVIRWPKVAKNATKSHTKTLRNIYQTNWSSFFEDKLPVCQLVYKIGYLGSVIHRKM